LGASVCTTGEGTHRIVEKRPEIAHRGELHSETEAVVLAATAFDLCQSVVVCERIASAPQASVTRVAGIVSTVLGSEEANPPLTTICAKSSFRLNVWTSVELSGRKQPANRRTTDPKPFRDLLLGQAFTEEFPDLFNMQSGG
jgi:hypothetical protein